MLKSVVKFVGLFAFMSMLPVFGLHATQARAAASIPVFSLPNVLNGAMMDSRSLNGKVVLINFFTTW